MKYDAWTERDTVFILAHWETLDDPALARALGRTCAAIQIKRLELGLKRPRFRPPRRDEGIQPGSAKKLEPA
jgi:hypothetical protein